MNESDKKELGMFSYFTPIILGKRKTRPRVGHWLYHDRGPSYANRRWIAVGGGRFIERCSYLALSKAILGHNNG